MHNGMNVMVCFKPGVCMRMYYSLSDTGRIGKKEIRVLLSADNIVKTA